MAKAILFVLLLVQPACVFGQKVFMIQDSSHLIFPNHVTIDFVQRSRRGATTYEFNSSSMKTLLLQCNYLYGILDVTLEREQLQQKQALAKDSSIYILKDQLRAADQRIVLYSSGYESLKSVSDEYDKQVKSLIAELDMLRKKDRKQRRKVFSKGLVVGLASGIAITTFFVLRRN